MRPSDPGEQEFAESSEKSGSTTKVRSKVGNGLRCRAPQGRRTLGRKAVARAVGVDFDLLYDDRWANLRASPQSGEPAEIIVGMRGSN